MRIQNGFIVVITVILAALMTAGTIHTEQFSQASVAGSGGFDALAHALFDGLFGVGPASR
ncbi:hypothetical protein KY495_22515 [Massilia sp. PAMC28688]|uniref:hypothetical protein n=1 Tax=Massilia sp. PAMC28688 TaxID=2861283 RepID=UPI001C636C42|nr:hypothetical protein [Massilia sp. PAMC28688]QYF93408.1 hypothetical protein KY495_22515 [Massilia sp. PAMC28688]